MNCPRHPGSPATHKVNLVGVGDVFMCDECARLLAELQQLDAELFKLRRRHQRLATLNLVLGWLNLSYAVAGFLYRPDWPYDALYLFNAAAGIFALRAHYRATGRFT